MNIFHAIGLLRQARKFSWLVLAGLAVATPPAHGRLAETRAQVEARYGKPLSQRDDKETPGLCVCGYEHDGLSIEVTYIQGVCYEESYTRTAGRPLSADEVSVLREANRCGLVWLTPWQGRLLREGKARRQNDGTVVSIDWQGVPGGDAGTNILLEQPSNRSVLCNPQLHYEECAESGREPDGKGNPTGAFRVSSFSIQKYVEETRAARAKAGLKGF